MAWRWMMTILAALMLAAGGSAQAQVPPSMVGKCMDGGKVRNCDGPSLLNVTGLGLQSMWRRART